MEPVDGMPAGRGPSGRRAGVLCAALVAGVVAVAGAAPALAATEIRFWHAFTGRLGELLEGQVAAFNARETEYQVVAAHKGNYGETLSAGIAAFRAGRQPHILQVYEVGTASMMAARGAVKPVYRLMRETGQPFDPESYLAAVRGYYTTTAGELLSLPYNSSTPVLYVNSDLLAAAGLDPDMALDSWEKVGAALDILKGHGQACPLTTAWQSWIHLENLSAYHNVPFATEENGFASTGARLAFNGALQVKHIRTLGEWARDGRFVYRGRTNEAGTSFRAGECALYTESSAGYAGVKAAAKFAFRIRPLPYWESEKARGAPWNTIIGGASLWVMEGHDAGDYPGVARFLSFLSSPEVQQAWHQDTGYLPITTAAYEATRAAGFYRRNPGTDVAIIQMTGKPPLPDTKGVRLGYFSQIRTIVDESLEAVWAGEQTAQQALDSAVMRGNVLLRRFEREQG